MNRVGKFRVYIAASKFKYLRFFLLVFYLLLSIQFIDAVVAKLSFPNSFGNDNQDLTLKSAGLLFDDFISPAVLGSHSPSIFSSFYKLLILNLPTSLLD